MQPEERASAALTEPFPELAKTGEKLAETHAEEACAAAQEAPCQPAQDRVAEAQAHVAHVQRAGLAAEQGLQAEHGMGEPALSAPRRPRSIDTAWPRVKRANQEHAADDNDSANYKCCHAWQSYLTHCMCRMAQGR